MTTDSYCIRSDYAARPSAQTLVDDIENYWTAQRIQTATQYQWDVYGAVAEHLRSDRNLRVADVGCGFPRKIELLIEPMTEHITLIDQPSMAPLMGKEFPDYRFVPVDLETPNAEGVGKFDCIVCADVIEHLLDPDPLVNFLSESLESNGRLFISTPERNALRGAQCRTSPNPEHVREWSFDEFGRYLESRGLKILAHLRVPTKRLSALDGLLPPAVQRRFPRRYGACQLVVCQA